MTLTPVFCNRCGMWVPLEREPHVGALGFDAKGATRTTPPHHAIDTGYPHGFPAADPSQRAEEPPPDPRSGAPEARTRPLTGSEGQG